MSMNDDRMETCVECRRSVHWDGDIGAYHCWRCGYLAHY
jgi:predicted RNA-binding Zn-ribbon protein involved in translation (DUF1610 family)